MKKKYEFTVTAYGKESTVIVELTDEEAKIWGQLGTYTQEEGWGNSPDFSITEIK